MKAVVFFGDRKAAIVERKDPEPKRGEVVVRMKASGICGSDMHKYRLPRKEFLEQGLENLIQDMNQVELSRKLEKESRMSRKETALWCITVQAAAIAPNA
jgi:hypothetical protein